MSDGVATTVVDGAQFVANRAGGLVNAVNNVMDAILWPFVQPLIEVFELAIGDPDQLQAKSKAWNAVAAEVEKVAGDLAGQRQTLATRWKGDAGTAAQKSLTETEEHLRDVAKRMRETARTMEQIAELLSAYEQLLQDTIRELVEWLIVEWIVAQILAPETLGASEVGFLGGAAPATSSVFVARCVKYLNDLRKALWEFRKVYNELKAGSRLEKFAAKLIKKQISGVIGDLTGLNHSKFGAFTTMAGDILQYGIHTAAEEFDDRRSGIDGNDDPMRQKISEYVDPIADKADPYLDKVEETVDPYVDKAKETVDPYIQKAREYLPD
ncbi:WXG100 family type VII secretion target [Actinoplanes sp. NPDC051851]|uniref:WXG100 family type VII secretion target n=1 Tax=Actinoplanes sp. NPDC051851 TaxID=3154753 RepID=UPI00344920C8